VTSTIAADAGPVAHSFKIVVAGSFAAGKSTLDDHYRGAVQKSPEARLAWNRTFQTYSSWLAKQR